MMINSLSRKKDYREMMFKNLATSLILYEEIKTTKAKAKALKPIIEHLIAATLTNDNKLTAYRRLKSYLLDKNAVKKMQEVIVPRFKKTRSGFIKSYNLPRRKGDGAEMTVLVISKEKMIEEKKVENAEEQNTKTKSK